ncbi:CCHC-type domain-containing protein [Durusdinium trenchii]|uniref:CCHC-type domain-containing protein n=1 Tax=Durusdinium trenchii TaxID=1381693 RepID=A0ABP0KL89_9DINO
MALAVAEDTGETEDKATDKDDAFDMPWKVATIMELGQRAYLREDGVPEWLWARIHEVLGLKASAFKFLRNSLKGLTEFLQREAQVDPAEVKYNTGKTLEAGRLWKDHTLESRAFFGLGFWIMQNKPLAEPVKLKALKLVQQLGGKALDQGLNSGSTMDGMVIDREGVVHYECLQLVRPHFVKGLDKLWAHCPGAIAMWKKLRGVLWHGQCISTAIEFASFSDLTFFVGYLAAHPTQHMKQQNMWLCCGKLLLPTLCNQCGYWLDGMATQLANEELSTLPMLKTKYGNVCKTMDPVNRMLLLKKLQAEKVHRRRVGKTHDLQPLQSLWARHEPYLDCVLHARTLLSEFPCDPLQVSVSFDPGNYDGKQISAGVAYNARANQAAYLLNQTLGKLMMSEVDDSLIEKAKQRKLTRISGFNEMRGLDAMLVHSLGKGIKAFAVPEGLLVKPLLPNQVRLRGEDGMVYIWKAAEEEDDDKEESDRQERGGATSTVRDKMEGYKWSDAEWAEWNRRWQWGTSWQTSWTQHTSGEKKDSETGVTGVPASAMPSTGVDHSDPWQRPNVDPWSRRTSMSGAPHESGRHDGWWGTQTYHKGDYSDPPSWSGWGYRLWRRAVIRWNDHTDIAVWRRADRVLRTLEWDLQAKLDHISEATLASPAFLTEILAVLDVLAGEKADSERKRAVRAALFEGSRRADESIAQYALRRESQFEVASRYITLPDDVKGILLEEQSGLTKQAMQNLRVLTKGQHSYSEVKKALHVLDVEEESMIKPGKVSYFEDLAEYAETDLEDDDDEEIFLAIENEHVAEEEAVALLADLQQDRRRTWKENKLLKAARRKDRRHFDDKSSRPARPFNRRRMSVEELKKITFCGNCGKKGHWREDCSESVKDSSRQPKTKTNAFVFLGISEEAKSSAAFFLGALSDAKSMNGACFLELNPGQAIVDPGASQDLIGLPSFEKLQTKLARVGLQAIKLDEAPGKAAGVGGSAKTLFMALSPCILGGQPGIIKLTVVEDDVPQLLSIGLLEHGEAVIDTGTDKIHFRKFGTEARMTRLPSGHRTLDVAEWSGGDFPIPEKLTRELGLCPGAFNLSPSARRAYMSGFACFGDRSQLFQFFQIQKSQADSEALENHWYHFTRKMIIMHGGPRALERLGKTIYQGDFTPSRADASGVMKLPACQHPKEYEVKGANQHGTWTRCSLCQTKTSYVKYSKDNPPPAVRRNKSAAVETHVSAQPMPRTPMASGSAASTSALMPDLEQLLQGQTQQLTQSTAAVMSQVMSPVVEGFHQALRYQAEEMQRSQERQETQIQQLFLAQQRIMRQTDPACQPGAAFPMMSQEELHRRMAQSLAMAQGYPLPPDEEEWDRVSENMSGR